MRIAAAITVLLCYRTKHGSGLISRLLGICHQEQSSLDLSTAVERIIPFKGPYRKL
jgi:hypothetical protein